MRCNCQNTAAAYPELCGAVLHSDRGSQYTSASYRAMLNEYGVRQSMNSAGGRCHDNARCESIRGLVTRMKNELFYSRGRRSTDYTTEQLKTMIWRYYMSYWNNRRICSSIGGMPAADITRIRRANRRPPQWNKYPLRYASWIFIPLHCCSKFLSEMCKAILTITRSAPCCVFLKLFLKAPVLHF